MGRTGSRQRHRDNPCPEVGKFDHPIAMTISPDDQIYVVDRNTMESRSSTFPALSSDYGSLKGWSLKSQIWRLRLVTGPVGCANRWMDHQGQGSPSTPADDVGTAVRCSTACYGPKLRSVTLGGDKEDQVQED